VRALPAAAQAPVKPDARALTAVAGTVGANRMTQEGSR
jgi:hypothetical protein